MRYFLFSNYIYIISVKRKKIQNKYNCMKRIEMPKKKIQIMYDVKKHEIKLFLDDSKLVWI